MTSTPDNNKLICHIIHRLDYGGLENGLVNIINGLPAEKYRHAIICLQHSTDFRERIQRGDVPIFEMHKKPGKDISIYAKVWKILRQIKPDIVHTRNLPALDMLLVAKLAGVRKLVHSEHGLDVYELAGTNAKYNRLRYFSQFFTNRFVALSRDLYDWLTNTAGISKEKALLIYNGVDTDRFSPSRSEDSILPHGFAPEDGIIIGAIGRLETVKNQTDLARAFIKLLEDNPRLRERLRLVVVGDGSLLGEIENLLIEHDARDLAWMPGFLDNPSAIYRSLDLFVLPSLREGISNTLLEAMASGLPVVANRTGGNPEIMLEGETGLLCGVGDVDAMAQALMRYVEDPELRFKHGEAGRLHVVRNFSLAAMMENYRKMYDGL